GRSGGRLRARSLHYLGTGTEISSGGLKMVMNASPRFIRPSLIATAALAAAVTLAPQAAQARGSSGPGGGRGHSVGSRHPGGYRRVGWGYYPYGWGWGWAPYCPSWLRGDPSVYVVPGSDGEGDGSG